ncbi:unnamed protein product [Trichobilharzia regenti]|nr:unnamed protein product [Trichobilharzia regenti]
MDSTQITYDYLIPSFISTVTHPMTYARALMLVRYHFLAQNKLSSWVMNHFHQFGDFLYVISFNLNMKHTTTQMSSHTVSHLYKYSNTTEGHKLRQEVGLYSIFTTGLPASVIGSFVKSYSTDRIMEKQSCNDPPNVSVHQQIAFIRVLVAGTTHGLTVTSTVMAARDSRYVTCIIFILLTYIHDIFKFVLLRR